jgi:hypothetical protein
MKKCRFRLLLLASALGGVLWLVTSCTPKDTAPVIPATNPPPAMVAPVTIPVTNPPATNQIASVVMLTPEEAKHHVGETAIVRGKVFGVHVSQKGDVFLNLGGKHPNAPFTAVCFQQAIPTSELQAWDGKIISVRGKIKEYNGQIEIILETADQILN